MVWACSAPSPAAREGGRQGQGKEDISLKYRVAAGRTAAYAGSIGIRAAS